MPTRATGTGLSTQGIMYRGQDTRSFENVVPGSTARLTIVDGFLYHFLNIEYSGITVAQMNEVRVKLNNQNYYRLRGTDLDVINFYYGGEDSDTIGILKIPFSRSGLKVPGQEVLTSVNMQVLDGGNFAFTEMEIEIDIDGAAAAPTLRAVAARQPADQSVSASGSPVGPGYVRRLMDFTQPSSFVGRNTLRQLVIPGQPQASRLFLNALYMELDPAHIREIQVKRDGVDEEFILPRTNEALQREAGRKPVAGWTVIDPTVQGIGMNGFDFSTQIDEFTFTLDLQNTPAGTPVPPNFRFIADYIGLPTR